MTRLGIAASVEKIVDSEAEGWSNLAWRFLLASRIAGIILK
jgi:hypothetical protein